MRGRRRMHGDLYRVGWHLVICPNELAKSGFQTNIRRRAKHTAVCTSASMLKGCIECPGCLAPSEGSMNLAIGHRSLMGYVTMRSLWARPFSQPLEIGTPKSIRAVFSPWRNQNPMTWRWKIEKLSCGMNYTLFSFLLCSPPIVFFFHHVSGGMWSVLGFVV